MKHISVLAVAALLLFMVSCRKQAGADQRAFSARGVVEELKPDGQIVVIKHEAIRDYMNAMTMPFRVKEAKELAGLQAGDEVSFQLFVTADESWIDHVTKTGRKFSIPAKPGSAAATNAMPSFKLADIPDFALTNELGQPVSLRQYQGKAVALTFFFTRCPIPEYCPRLSRNMEEASAKLKAMTNGPTNWQLLSISFDPLDRPEVLNAYGRRYQYDPTHWSFLTGNPDHIRELTRGFGVAVASDGAFYTHDFATAVFDATGRLQTLWRFGGNTSDLIVNEILKAAAATQTAAVIGSK
jgi:protein SCO1/2